MQKKITSSDEWVLDTCEKLNKDGLLNFSAVDGARIFRGEWPTIDSSAWMPYRVQEALFSEWYRLQIAESCPSAGYMQSIGLGDALQKADELCARFGHKKHGEARWKHRTSEHHMQAAQRHLDAAFEGGATALDESGSTHLIHAAVRCLMAAESRGE